MFHKDERVWLNISFYPRAIPNTYSPANDTNNLCMGWGIPAYLSSQHQQRSTLPDNKTTVGYINDERNGKWVEISCNCCMHTLRPVA